MVEAGKKRVGRTEVDKIRAQSSAQILFGLFELQKKYEILPGVFLLRIEVAGSEYVIDPNERDVIVVMGEKIEVHCWRDGFYHYGQLESNSGTVQLIIWNGSLTPKDPEKQLPADLTRVIEVDTDTGDINGDVKWIRNPARRVMGVSSAVSSRGSGRLRSLQRR